MNKKIKYIPSVILVLLLPIIILFPTLELSIAFIVFSIFSFHFLKESNKENDEKIQGKINKLEDDLNNRINLVEEELKKNQDKAKELNSILASFRMSGKNPTQR